VLADDIGEDAFDRVLVAYYRESVVVRVPRIAELTIAVMAGDLGHSIGARVLILEDLDQFLCLLLGFFLYNDGVSFGCLQG
jgi:hypothetical protein